MQLRQERNELYKALEAFVRQREQNLSYAQVKRLNQLEALSRLKRQVSAYQNASLDLICRVIIKSESDLRLLIPAEQSRFHAGALKRVNTLVSYAKRHLNIEQWTINS